MNEKYARQMKKGVLDMLMLKLLLPQPKYGYQLISELKEKSCGVFTLKEGTLYPVLYRLEDEMLVESRWREPEGKQLPRKYYAITEQGRETLKDMDRLWRQISAGIRRIMEEEAYEG